MKRQRHQISTMLALPALVVGLLMCACAQIGNPSGGPIDEAPPVVVRMNPPDGATGVPENLRRATIDFNEIVNVKDPQSVIVSPPQATMPRIVANGRRVNITFQDSLLPNTTYTIDFGKTVEDNNESNPLEDLTYSFSTGSEIDSLIISGMVLGAKDLEPQQGVLVGVHTDMADSAFTTRRFDRVARTDDQGRFSIRNLAHGTYRLYALTDANNDRIWDNPAEDIAFYPLPVTPSAQASVTTDTLYNSTTGLPDSTYTRSTTLFLPNNLLLSHFNIDYKPQYLVKYERPDSTRIVLTFNAPADSLPQVSVVGAPKMKDWYLAESSAHNDTITYWLTKPSIIHTDTLRLAVNYMRHNNERVLQPSADTLRLISPVIKPAKKSKRKNTDTVPPAPVMLGLKALTSSQHEIYQPLMFETDRPIASIDSAAFRLETKDDTLWKPLPRPDITLAGPRRLLLTHPLEFGREYRLDIDTLALTDIYGYRTKPLKHSYTVRKESEYSNLTMNIVGLPDSIAAFAELLNSSDTPVRRAEVTDGAADFPYIAPGTYYMRLTEDTDSNGIFTTGDYDLQRQPEAVYYYPSKINLKKNWSIDQTWDINSTPADKQKPEAITKNKPTSRRKGRTQQRTDDEEDDDDYFDVNENPFDPGSRRRTGQNGQNSQYGRR